MLATLIRYNNIFSNSLKVLFLIAMMLFSLHAFSQSSTNQTGFFNQDTVIKSVYIIGVASVSPNETDDEFRRLKEGEELMVGQVVRTSDDSALRIIFPDGTAQTLCENTTYQVLPSGEEEGVEGEDTNKATITAFNRCKIRPQHIGVNCFYDRNSVVNLESERLNRDFETEERGRQLDADSENFIQPSSQFLFESDQNRRQLPACSLGENLFATYVPLEPEQPAVEVKSPKPAPAPTVPETGGSPI